MHYRGALLFIFIIVFIYGCSAASGFEDYRYNPFQFPYPEYYLKAEKIKTIETVKRNKSSQPIDLFGVKALVPRQYDDIAIRNNNAKSPTVLKKNGGIFLFAAYHEEDLLGCNSPTAVKMHRDFCSAFDSTEEFNKKLFTLTPEAITSPNTLSDGDLWIIHRKGMIFKKTQKIKMYQLKNLTAFRQDLKKSATGKIQIHVFPKSIAPDSIEIIIFEKDENLVKTILSSINQQSRSKDSH